jgi:predicted CXXCH cytochrome family protein
MRNLAVAIALLLAADFAGATGGAYTSTKHGDTSTGVQRLSSEGRGECSQCHDEHASRLGVSNGGPFPYLLFAPDDNSLCFTCHTAAGGLAVYPGSPAYALSSHALSSSMVWPGPVPPGRSFSDSGLCVNCHQPHGASDASGVIPAMTFAREESLCLPCHDGSPALSDIAADFTKLYRHPVEIAGKHSESEGSDPAKFGASPANNRHAECADCHNPHVAKAPVLPPTAPAASPRLAGVSRVRVTNGLAGTQPTYTWLSPDDATPAAEYETCFKCHSSWTMLPLSASDLGVVFNPSNASFHPVEAPGTNGNIAAGAFTAGWSDSRLTYCSDCHGSDDATRSGPHGSTFPHILKGSSATTSLYPQAISATDLCFMCHTFDSYANPTASAAALSASRFNPPSSGNGHSYHVGAQAIPCRACHDAHGSVLLPALITTGRSPGIVSYSQTPTGGTCAPTCHAFQAYSVNYAR